MTIVNMLEAKTNLSRLIAEVEAGGEVVIARHNKPVVRLVAVDASSAVAAPAGVAEPASAWAAPAPAKWRVPGRLAAKPDEKGYKRQPGTMKGLIEWDDRFNDPLPDDELRLWNGEGD
ncbi:MAG: type II toxin-antitoxin system prevent-host-death family antitoxin [Sphingomonadaceae bacterium]|nr:type II toxin-antitoxin system prevent-host-death family antitoxin [Sphingomonadaceae bacterium]